ncbi:type I-MYXAN CRISPR-associated Cas8a1/Cmx1 [Laspinema olomoucense]|uniref:type I-MYXAN CRISPR-associated Cas8a1/Cmx1 n=1 Tax=Laspinema olomoucense TaxID=3231600 RepID=UPI0021BB40AE|nr:type I-MYXAN CRISPR-associated Cas8a1/Cmx1 [Laspinema sp. D3c]MCT7995551.1 type I-MYXAN CRISPR-associated Cas8a1/Cmx1 [Laspinema sp. D3c]
MQTITLNLGNPHLTGLHRAGMAGLWMTLQQLGKDIPKGDRPGQLDWQLNPRQVLIHWQGHDFEVLDWLLKQSFQTTPEGFISLRGLNSDTLPPQQKWVLHQGMLRTFLQHTSTHKSDGKVSIVFTIDEVEFPISYKSITSYAHQEFANNLCDKQGNLLKKAIGVAGWLNPGAVVRHTAFSSSTSFEENPTDALLLLFAPVACYYFLLRSKLRDKRAQYALVVPEIVDLEAFATIRQHREWRKSGYKDFCATGLGDAGLQFLTHESVTQTAQTYQVKSCQVITFGTVSWSSQQMTRTELHLIESSDHACENYQILRQIPFFTNQVRSGDKGGFITVSFARELITENLAHSYEWYQGFSTKVHSRELFQKLTYDREGLYQMVQKSQWDTQSKQLFVQACHQAIGNTYGKAAGRAENSNKTPDFDRINVKIRSKLGRCKNAASFRAFITDFWSRAGKVSLVQDNWRELMELITGEDNWKLGRDLFLLALASYKGSKKETPEGVEESPEDEKLEPVEEELQVGEDEAEEMDWDED